MGIVRPGDMGFDVMHINLHKTFSTPHGGGGPGSGPVGVKKHLMPFMPVPVLVERNGMIELDYDRPESFGRVKSFYGNFGVIVKAYAYIRSLGGKGLKEASENAVLNANYIMNALRGTYEIPHDRICMHECVIAPGELLDLGVHTTDIAKALIDRGYHPPTIYFPLIVHEAMMIEPTETESRDTLDEFIEAMKAITMIDDNPDLAWVFPEEGSVLSVDSMCIPATSEKQEAAEMFINFMCEVDIGKANAEYIGYTTPMQAVWEVLDEDLKYSEIAFPSEEIEAKEKVFTALSDEVNSELDVKWSEMKSYDEGGSGIVFLMLLLAMVALACFNIWRKLRKKSRNMY